MLIACRSVAILALAGMLSTPVLANAQTDAAFPIPKAEVSAGYMLLRDVNSEENFPGWFFSGAFNTNRWFAIVGEASGGYEREQYELPDIAFAYRAELYTVLGGPRVFRQFGRVVPFAQALVGASHMRLGVDITRSSYPNQEPETQSSRTDFAFQPGGGVTVYIAERVGLRVAGDYRVLVDRQDEEWDAANEFRVVAGLTFGWGAR